MSAEQLVSIQFFPNVEAFMLSLLGRRCLLVMRVVCIVSTSIAIEHATMSIKTTSAYICYMCAKITRRRLFSVMLQGSHHFNITTNRTCCHFHAPMTWLASHFYSPWVAAYSPWSRFVSVAYATRGCGPVVWPSFCHPKKYIWCLLNDRLAFGFFQVLQHPC